MHTLPSPNTLAYWQLTREDGTDMKLELARFGTMPGLERAACGRVTTLLLLQLYACATAGTNEEAGMPPL